MTTFLIVFTFCVLVGVAFLIGFWDGYTAARDSYEKVLRELR